MGQNRNRKKKGKGNQNKWTGFESGSNEQPSNSSTMGGWRCPKNLTNRNGKLYCWTHGINCNHRGTECTRRHPNHNPNATWENCMGGTQRIRSTSSSHTQLGCLSILEGRQWDSNRNRTNSMVTLRHNSKYHTKITFCTETMK